MDWMRCRTSGFFFDSSEHASSTGEGLTIFFNNGRSAVFHIRVTSRFCGRGSALFVEQASTFWSRRVLLDRNRQHGSSLTDSPTDITSAAGHSFLRMRRVQGKAVCCPDTSGRWPILSSDNMLNVVSVNHRVELLNVTGKQTYPSQAEQIDHFEFPVVKWRLCSRLRHGQEADVISILEGLPESTNERTSGLDLEGQALSFKNVLMCATPSMWLPTSNASRATFGSAPWASPFDTSWMARWLSLSCYQRGIVAEPSQHGVCSARVLSRRWSEASSFEWYVLSWKCLMVCGLVSKS